MESVVITGAGTFNALGKSVLEMYTAFESGACGIVDLQFDRVEGTNIKYGGQIRYSPDDYSVDVSLDKHVQFALIAAQEALDQAQLDLSDSESMQTGVIIGCADGGTTTADAAYHRIYALNKSSLSPATITRVMNSAATSAISMKYKLKGPSFTVSSACASSNHAIAQAYYMIASGMAPVMLAGGAESIISLGGLKGWERLRVIDQPTSRPFSPDRAGMIPGEGAAVFVLESETRAKRRGANILAYISGVGMSADAQNLVRPDIAGAIASMRAAVRTLPRIDYVNAHGTGTFNDSQECEAIAHVCGPVLCSSTKPAHGHCIGATSAIEAISCLFAIQRQRVAPTVCTKLIAEDCQSVVHVLECRDAKIDYTLSNAFAFGGLNCSIVFSKEAIC